MNDVRHSMDDLFRQKLGDLSTDPPMHIWEKIREKRNWWYRFQLKASRSWPLVGIALLVTAGLTILCWNRMQINKGMQLDSLPIPMNAAPGSTPTANLLIKGKEGHVKAADTPPEPPEKISAKMMATGHISSRNGRTFRARPKKIDIAPIKSIADLNTILSHTAPIRRITWSPLTSLPPAGMPAILDFVPIESGKLRPPSSPPLALHPIPAPTVHEYLLALEIYSGIFQPSKRLEAFSDSYLEFLRLREQTEEVQPGYSIGTRFSITFPNGIRLRTGLDFTQINERFDPEKISLRASGSSVSREPTRNRLQTFDLPILVGLEKQQGRFSLGINGGAFFNLRFTPTGNILSFANLEPISLSADSEGEPVFRQNIGTSWYGSLNVAYRFAPSMGISLEPYVRYFPGYFNDPNYVVNQKYLLSGLTISLRKELN